jgi:tetratricopeptide (TPR) repeat protein
VLASLAGLSQSTWVGRFFEPAPAQASPPNAADEYVDIGDFHTKVSTSSEKAQKWFDRGLAMCHAFNHEEAVRCFEQAIAADPAMPMAYWGLAYAWGPNINNMKVDTSAVAQAELALRLAKLHAEKGSPWEQAIIDAMKHRYTIPVPEDRTPLNERYAEDMRAAYEKFPEEPLVVAVFAESLMDLRPWKLWAPDGQPSDVTPELVNVLEAGLKRWPKHPMLCHLYIHAIEASPHPEKALEAANNLRNAMPGAGHLVHMPSHIDVRVGDYRTMIESNQRAIKADKEFVGRRGRDSMYTLYRVHNYHFLVYGAMFDGQSQLAMESSREMVQQMPEEMLRALPDMLDAYVPTPLHVLIRYGKWDEILQEPEPADYLPMSRSMWRYARGVAFAAKGQVEEAEKEEQEFLKQRAAVPETSMLFNNPSQAVLGVAEKMLRGEIAYRRRNYDEAFAALREAVQRDDALNYDEPWGWMQPGRHALGALLLEQEHGLEAEKIFREDLKRHPNNLWALQGLQDALVQLDKIELAAEVGDQFKKAIERCDIEIDRPCFCKQKRK